MRLVRFTTVSATIVIIFLLMQGCAVEQAGYVKMEVRGYPDPETQISRSMTFGLAPLESEQPLVEKNLLYEVKSQLQLRGWQYSEDSPDFLVSIQYYIGPFAQYEPEKYITLPYYVKGDKKTTTGFLGNSYVNLTEKSSGQWTARQYKVRDAQVTTQYYRNIRLYFVDYPSLIRSDTVRLLWTGEVESEGGSSDILYVAPTLISELLREFPARSGEPPYRVRQTEIR